jgi:nitrite reductase/ring-hydroxylating ferredoxin subunit
MSMETEDSTNSQVCIGCGKIQQSQLDFPIEWEGDHYVSRREMVKFLTLGSFLLAMANWVTAFARGLIRKDSHAVQQLGLASILDSQGSMLFRYPTKEDPCIAVRTPQGTLVAYSQVCTHLSCAVVYDKGNHQLICPCHRGAFNLEQGAPIAGPPTRPLARVKIEQRGNQIFATGLEV